MGNIPKVLSINDISGIGRVALSCSIPILSAMKIQPIALPTVLLSTSTAYNDFTYLKLTENMKQNTSHWKKLDIQFDGIMTGFIGDVEQVKVVAETIEAFRKNKPLVLVDPVMADEGKLYSVYNDSFVNSMRKLILKADVITPNVTEASLLLEDNADLDNLSEAKVKKWAKDLSKLGPSIVIITSVRDELSDKNICVLAYDSKKDLYYKATSKLIPISYPGTGDTFTSVVMGALMKNYSLQETLNLAVEFMSNSIQQTYNAGTDIREGILFENSLDLLMD